MEKGKTRAVVIRFSPDHTRGCDCCETQLVDSGGVTVKSVYLTAYGPLCAECFDLFDAGDPEILYIYSLGCDVTDAAWYLGQDYRHFFRRREKHVF